MKGKNQKLKLFTLNRILEEHTDDKHGLKMSRILDLWAVELGTNTLEATTVNALTVNADDVVCDLLTTSNLSFGGVVCKWNNAIQVCTRSATYYADTAWISYLDWDGNKKTMEVATGITQAQSPSYRTISYIGPV